MFFVQNNKRTSVAYRLQLAMDKKGLDGKTLAAKSGVSACSISSYLNSRALPTRRTAVRLSAILSVGVDWLLGVAPLEVESEVHDVSQETLVSLFEGLNSKNKKYLIETAVLLNKVQSMEQK